MTHTHVKCGAVKNICNLRKIKLKRAKSRFCVNYKCLVCDWVRCYCLHKKIRLEIFEFFNRFQFEQIYKKNAMNSIFNQQQNKLSSASVCFQVFCSRFVGMHANCNQLSISCFINFFLQKKSLVLSREHEFQPKNIFHRKHIRLFACCNSKLRRKNDFMLQHTHSSCGKINTIYGFVVQTSL